MLESQFSESTMSQNEFGEGDSSETEMSESASKDNSLSTQSLTSGGLSDSDTSVIPAPYSYEPCETDSESSLGIQHTGS